ncbi:MAG: hypothetical protein MZV70_07865 [Desulfobacterales bacterium]|nr:hypothetical protein [Desulfobacterales bacterium]
MPADNVEGFRPDVLALLRELNAPVLPLARRQLRERLQLARRHRRPRPAAAAQEPGVEGRRAQRRRHPRVHGALPPHRRRALHRREQRPGRRRVGGRAGGVRQRRGDHADGRAAGAQRQPGAVQGALVVRRQRDGRRLAARHMPLATT